MNDINQYLLSVYFIDPILKPRLSQGGLPLLVG